MEFLEKVFRAAKKVNVEELLPPQVVISETIPGRWVVGSIADNETLKTLWGIHLRMQIRFQRFIFVMQQRYPGQPIPQAIPQDDAFHGNRLHNMAHFSLQCFWCSVIDQWPTAMGCNLTLCRDWEIVASPMQYMPPQPPGPPIARG